jgi:hypothetical protein
MKRDRLPELQREVVALSFLLYPPIPRLAQKVFKSIKALCEKGFFSRKGAKAQRKPLRNAAALCAFAGETFSA